MFGWTPYPVVMLTRRDVRTISLRFSPCETPSASRRVRTIIATSSREQLPARSPIPFTATSTCLAPFTIPASEFATASPRSLWQCVEITMWSGTASRTVRTSSPNSCGIA